MRLLLTATAATFATAAAPAAAATIAVPPCLPSGEPTRMTGEGFAPGAPVTITQDGAQLGVLAAGPDGRVDGRVDTRAVERDTPVGFLASDGAALASTTATAVFAFGELTTLRGSKDRTVRLRWAGLPAGGPAWVHVRRGARTIARYRLRKRISGCGPQAASGRFLRRSGAAETRATLVINASRRSAAARPAAVLKVAVGARFVAGRAQLGSFTYLSSTWRPAGS